MVEGEMRLGTEEMDDTMRKILDKRGYNDYEEIKRRLKMNND